MVGPPGQRLTLVRKGWPVSRAVRVAGPPLTITMSLCAGTALANRAEKLSTAGNMVRGLWRAHECTQLHMSMHPYLHPKHLPGWALVP